MKDNDVKKNGTEKDIVSGDKTLLKKRARVKWQSIKAMKIDK